MGAEFGIVSAIFGASALVATSYVDGNINPLKPYKQGPSPKHFIVRGRGDLNNYIDQVGIPVTDRFYYFVAVAEEFRSLVERKEQGRFCFYRNS